MPNQKAKKTTKLSPFNPLRLKKWQKLSVFAIVFGLVGAAIIYKSFALTSDVVTGYEVWYGTVNSARYSKSVKSTDGWMKVAVNFKPTKTQSKYLPYHWVIQEYRSGTWVDVESSIEFVLNGSTNSQCHWYRVYIGRTYRAKFIPAQNVPVYMEGQYWLRGNKSTCTVIVPAN